MAESFKIIILLIMTLVIFGLGLLVYLSNRKSRINKSFGLFVICVALWSFGLAMLYVASLGAASLFWTNFLYVVASFIPTFFLYFSLVFPSGQTSFSRFKQISIFIPNIILFYLFFFTDFIVIEVALVDGVKGFIYGPGHIFWDLQFDVFFIWAFYNLIKKYKTTSGIIKAQLRYVVFGTLIGLILAGFTNVILPWFNIFKFLWLGPELTIIWVIAVAYAIFRYRLMDIRLVIKRSTVYLFSLITAMSLALLVWWLTITYLGPSPVIAGLVSLAAGIIVFTPLKAFLQKIANKYLFVSLYSYQETLKNLSSKLTAILDLDRLTITIVKSIINTMKLDKAGVLLREPQTGKFQIQEIIGFKAENGISLVKDNFLTGYLGKIKKPLVYEELGLAIRDSSSQKEKLNLKTLQANMKRIEAEACLPLFSGHKITGLIVLGRKLSGDYYSKEDLDLLQTSANQMALAIENARLYKKLKGFNQTLKQKINEATRDLKEANLHLQKLDKAKSDFLSIAAHQLRTPLTAVKGYLAMLLEGDYGSLADNQQKVVRVVLENSERLVHLVNTFLNVSRIEADRLTLDKTPTDIIRLLEKSLIDFRPEAEKKGLSLIFEKPQEKLPLTLIDGEKIKNVIDNLIDNAIKYTNKGEITLSIKLKDQGFLFSIEDTGIGIKKAEAPELFNKFTRGEGIAQVYTGGSGLGLYIAKKLVEAHKGRIWVESEGKDKGAKFSFWLPF